MEEKCDPLSWQIVNLAIRHDKISSDRSNIVMKPFYFKHWRTFFIVRATALPAQELLGFRDDCSAANDLTRGYKGRFAEPAARFLI